MMETFEEALDWLDSLQTFGIKPGLERMNWLLERLDHPERNLKAIHVAGTNGKGSTVQFLSQIIREAGQEVGTFTSPYVEHYTDRIAVDGREISQEAFIDLANRIRPHCEELAETEHGAVTEFEAMTVIAIVYFATVTFPDVVIFEVGLGGRLDSTNVIHPMVTVITNVSEDHTDVLGESIEEIAMEKAGIIKSGVPVVTGAEGIALDVIEKTAKDKKAKCYRLGHEFFYTKDESVQDGEFFCFQSPLSKKEGLHIRLKGKHQIKNASLALMALDHLYFFFGLYVGEEEIRNGLSKAVIAGRFEELIAKPKVILDGAHNPDAARQLAETLIERFPNHAIHIIFAVFKNKNAGEMIAHLEKAADTLIFTSFSHERANKAAVLATYSTNARKKVFGNPREAFEAVMDEGGDHRVIVVTGSLYFITEARKYFSKALK